MPKVKEVIKNLLQYGEEAYGTEWVECPNWPPDLFAVAATLLKSSGCYANSPSGTDDREKYKTEICNLGKLWRESGEIPRRSEILTHWRKLVSIEQDVTESTPLNETWWNAAFRLLTIADEAAKGMGIDLDPLKAKGNPSFFVLSTAIGILDEDSRPQYLPHWPRSICHRVGIDKACVQPKTRKPQVGCTLQTLSHNLALLPPVGEVNTFWRFSTGSFVNELKPLNILLIPFPFSMKTKEFFDSSPSKRTGKYFSLRQNWVPKISEMVSFVSDTINEAQKDGENIGAVVFPELSFDLTFARNLAKKLGKKFHNLEIFVAGVSENAKSKNSAYTCLFENGEIDVEWTQSKHHRWCLDRSQIERYKLSGVLNPARRWWENIEIGEIAHDGRWGRSSFFYTFRPGTTMVTLVCEDLARIEPMQGVLRAVGPNLIFALLLDGSQRDDRWSARYATAFADDPGSSVLTFTSMGMIFRGDDSIKNVPAKIALWKEPNSGIKELELPPDHHALLLNCCFLKEENITFDGRSDDGDSIKISLAGNRPVKTPNLSRHSWLDDPRR